MRPWPADSDPNSGQRPAALAAEGFWGLGFRAKGLYRDNGKENYSILGLYVVYRV